MSDTEHNNLLNSISFQNNTASNQPHFQTIIWTSFWRILTSLGCHPTRTKTYLQISTKAINTLPSDDRQLLLQMYPWNKLVKLDPLPMTRRLQNTCLNMTKKWTKTLFRLFYRFSAVICPIDVAFRTLYER
ncbi:18851_t:CDS:1 [Acaulospora morrowiae]|uniref:18851_t:CDS:1 n=1 Tax=Acaulospora morrowiae TaxID=94023 RepID=A0A9N9A9T2_9GLOM|nr:18851_t:CDS:1 [Acaulospora morrowiae]